MSDEDVLPAVDISELPPVRMDLTEAPPDVSDVSPEQAVSNQRTARKAAQILVAKHEGFHIPSAQQRQALVAACAAAGAVVYGKAFDIVKLPAGVTLSDTDDIRPYAKSVVFYEIKSTRRALGADFAGHFFSMSTAELLVAQSLGARFKFVFVKVGSHEYLELGLTDIFARARAVYPTWSIRF